MDSNTLSARSLETDACNTGFKPQTCVQVFEGHAITKRITTKAFLASLVACLGAMSAGIVMTYASPAVPDMNAHPNPFRVDKDQQSWIGSIFSLGALFGALFSGILMDRLGRKLGIMVTVVPFVIGWIVIAGSSSVAMLYVGRLMTGFCKGLLVGTSHVYIAEIAPAGQRGMMLSAASVANVLGNLYVYCFGFLLRWNWLAVVCAVVPSAMACLIAFTPETPRYLLLKGNRDEAEKSLRWLRGSSSDINGEIQEIENSLREMGDNAKLKEFLKPHLFKPLLIILGMFTIQEFSGNSVLRVYTVYIFQSAGNSINANVQSIILGAVGVVGTLVSSVTIDRIGRRALLIISSISMALCLTAAGVYFKVKEVDPTYAKDHLSWLPLVSLVVNNFSFAIAYDPIPWMIASELFPTRARGISNSVGGAWQGICFFVVTKFYQNLSDVIQNYGSFWFCAGVCVVGVFFAVFILPETKKKTLENIENTFK